MLERYIAKGNNYKTFFLIGSNGAGKTYNLLKIYERDTTKNIYISEEGEIHNRTHKNKVKLDLDNKVYIFESDERQRGNREVNNISKTISINPRLIELLTFCNKELNNINKIKKKSKGQVKILNILEIMTSIFLNSVSIILFDEPENYLDDSYLRIVAKLFALLEKAEIKVIVATHNPRLCELCNMYIDNVVLMDIKNIDGRDSEKRQKVFTSYSEIPSYKLKEIISVLDYYHINYIIVDKIQNYKVLNMRQFKDNSYENYYQKGLYYKRILYKIKTINIFLRSYSDSGEILYLIYDIERCIDDYRKKFKR